MVSDGYLCIVLYLCSYSVLVFLVQRRAPTGLVNYLIGKIFVIICLEL